MAEKAKSVKEYMERLPEERRNALEVVRKVILKNMGKGYEEGIYYGMITYYVPHKIYPAGYHCDPKIPLPYAGLASQKQYMSIYLMGLYPEPERDALFRERWAKTGKKLDMGRCCLRFKKVEDLALDLIAEAIAEIPVKEHIARYEAAFGDRIKKKKAK